MNDVWADSGFLQENMIYIFKMFAKLLQTICNTWFSLIARNSYHTFYLNPFNMNSAYTLIEKNVLNTNQ